MCEIIGTLIFRKLSKLQKGQKRIMQEIDDMKAKVDAAFASIKTSLDASASSLSNIQGDQAGLLNEIKKLQDQIGGGLSDADKATLSAVVASAESLVSSTGALADSLKATADAIPDATPPVV